MTKDEALKQALEAYLCREMPAGTVIGDPKWWAPKIANVIKEVLAQPAQEPVGMVKELFTQTAWEKLDLRGNTKVYITPPQRKPLTDEAVLDIADYYLYNGGKTYGVLDFARAIEAAHGIKENT